MVAQLVELEHVNVVPLEFTWIGRRFFSRLSKDERLNGAWAAPDESAVGPSRRVKRVRLRRTNDE